MQKLKCVLLKTAQPKGEHKETGIDRAKQEAEFLLTEVGKKNRIVWKSGTIEYVSDKKLESLQKNHTWATDF